jgi:hypothetical protein
MSNIEHFPVCGTVHHAVMKTKELTLKQILSVPCPTCGAATKEACELHTGAQRTEPHRDRKLSAAEAVDGQKGERGKQQFNRIHIFPLSRSWMNPAE